MAFAVVVVTNMAVNGQVLVEDNSVLVGQGTWARVYRKPQANMPVSILSTMTFVVHLSMPGYTCEHMCIPFSVIREISGQLITTISLAHNINLVVSVSDRVFTDHPPAHTLPTTNGA